MSVADYIQALVTSARFSSQVSYHHLFPERTPCFGTLLRPLSAAVQGVLQRQNIQGLYTHQTEAIDRIRAGQDVVIATPTASGKSLIYNLPLLERHLADPDAHALYLFPLKALAQDQCAGLRALTAHWPEEARLTAAVYDGDSSASARRALRRDPPSVLITNPEMLHLSLLPYHEQWARFWAGLTHVVVDEAHIYRGVFGAHVAQLFRRLTRIAGRYGARPLYTFCTATVGNPGALGASLMGSEAAPVVIARSGAPQGKRHIVFLNPDDSPSTLAIALLQGALARNLRTIVYCKSRRMTELISLWAGQSGKWKGRISAYRAGFLPEERRAIEARMGSGELLAVVSTSALELGIDIGNLDICILVGYPGTVVSTLQRGGRVGRAGQESAVLLVAGEDALDQYVVRHPKEFLQRPPEQAIVTSDNEVILERHLECAAAEQALQPRGVDAVWLQSPAAQRCLTRLERRGALLRSAEGNQLFAARKRPQRRVDLRGCGESFTIQDPAGTVIGMVDGFRAWRETHPGAVYLHQGRSYVIRSLDPGSGSVHAEAARVNYFTRVRGSKTTEILEVLQTRRVGCTCVYTGRLRITEILTGYEKRSVSGNRLLQIVPMEIPPYVFETEGIWFAIPDPVRTALETEYLHFMGSIHAMEHAAIGIVPLLVMADRNDFGGISIPMHPQLGVPAVFVYDGLPGGAGLTRAAFERADEWLAATFATIAECPCQDGCPSCVHSPKCGSGNRPMSKEGARRLLELLLRSDFCPLPEPRMTISPVVTEDRTTPPALNTAEDAGHDAEKRQYGRQVADRHRARQPEGNADLQESRELARHDGRRPRKRQMEEHSGSGQTGETTATGHSQAVTEYPLSLMAARQADSAPEDLTGTPPARYMVLDVETRRSAAEVGGWHLAKRMGVSIAVLYDAQDDRYTPYTQDALPQLFARLREADVVVGFNIERFDYAVLQPFAPYDLHSLSTLDLLTRLKDRLCYRVSLDNLGKATFQQPKSADGLQALRWWKEGNLEAISTYCRDDVSLTRRLYLHGLEKGYVLFSNKAGQIVRAPADFRTACR